jgi:hypothetical protein
MSSNRSFTSHLCDADSFAEAELSGVSLEQPPHFIGADVRADSWQLLNDFGSSEAANESSSDCIFVGNGPFLEEAWKALGEFQ